MSEEKVIQHTKKAVHAVADKEKSWAGRIKEFLSEIFIIVVAVSITLWFHNWNDRVHEHDQEKEFLIGIRANLRSDTNLLRQGIEFMQTPIKYYDNVLRQVNSKKINTAYVDSNSSQLINDLIFTSDKGLFESFKSSGGLRLIENQKLLNAITSLYASQLPFLENNEEHIFSTREQEFAQYIGSKYGIDSSWNSPISSHLNDAGVLFHIRKYDIFLKELNRHRQDMINEISRVLSDLDKELDNRFNIKPGKQS